MNLGDWTWKEVSQAYFHKSGSYRIDCYPDNFGKHKEFFILSRLAQGGYWDIAGTSESKEDLMGEVS
jgi:hypothetical protein